jgi:hypothetical protein
MNMKTLSRASLAVVACAAALSLSACDWGTIHRGDIGRVDPPGHWHDGPGRWGRPGDHRGDPGDHRGGRGGDHGRVRARDVAKIAPAAGQLKAMADLDDQASGRMFDGSR